MYKLQTLFELHLQEENNFKSLFYLHNQENSGFNRFWWIKIALKYIIQVFTSCKQIPFYLNATP